MLLVLSGHALMAQSTITLTSKDLKPLIGAWQGSLTYLDYTTGEPYTMPADIDIKRIGKTHQYTFFNKYPDEPKANSTDKVSLSADGTEFNKEKLTSKRRLPNKGIEFTTEVLGQDGNDNKPALFRHTYTITKTTYTCRKEVQFVGTTAWIKRHEYSYKR